MPHDLLASAAGQMFYWSVKGRSYRRPESRGAHRAKEVGITALLLVSFCSSSARADTFGLGTAGPDNWGVLETGSIVTSEVQFNGGTTSSPAGISVNPGANASQANVGINNGGKLNSAATTVIQGAYYMFSGNRGDSISDTTIVGGTLTGANVDSKLSTAASDATAASQNLAGLTANQTFTNTITTTTTITATVPGQNVINLENGINLGNGVTLTLSGSATQSFVINIPDGGITLGVASQILLTGGLTPANVIFNLTNTIIGRNNVSVTGANAVINGIVMDLNGSVSLTGQGDVVNGEVISSQNISFTNGSDVEVVEVVPEASTAAYFTLGPLSLVAVMLLHRRFLRRKQSVICGSHDPPESVPGAVKWG
jgi:hypothetical protein